MKRFAMLIVILAACGSSGNSADNGDAEAFVECDNGVIVYSGIDCSQVSFDPDNMNPVTQARVDELRAEAAEDPSLALPHAQSIQRLMATEPFQVCEALQTDPDGEFLKTDAIAPVAEEFSRTLCPSLDLIEAAQN